MMIDWGLLFSIVKGGKSSFELLGMVMLDDDFFLIVKKGMQKRKVLVVDVDDDEGVSLNCCYCGCLGVYFINRDLEILGRGEDVDV